VPAAEICVWPFASGLNNAGEVIGFTRAGLPPGLTVWRLEKGSWRRSCAAWPDDWDWVDKKAAHCMWAAGQVLKMGDVPIFYDSGAYSVIKEWEKGEKANKLGKHEWEVVLSNYMALAQSQRKPRTLWPVLPDEIGSQPGTFKQLKRFGAEIRDLLRAKVSAIGVLHKGKLSLPDCAYKMAETLGTDKFVVAFPVVGGRTTPEEVAAAIDRMPIKPLGYHLLGISPGSDQWPMSSRALADAPRTMTLSTDAALVRGLVMRKRYLGPLTKEQDEVDVIIESTVRHQRKFKDPLLRPNLSIRHELVQPDLWLAKGDRERIIEAAIDEGLVQRRPYKTMKDTSVTVEAGEEPPPPNTPEWWEDWHWRQMLSTFYAAPSAALPLWVGPNWKKEPMASWLAGRLQEAYLRTLRTHTTALRKEQAIRRHITGKKPNRLLRPDESLPVRPACFVVPRLAQMELKLNPEDPGRLDALAAEWAAVFEDGDLDWSCEWEAAERAAPEFTRRTGLEFLGAGNTRAVFALDDQRVIKLAFYSSVGTDSNLHECERWFTTSADPELGEDARRWLAPVLACASGGEWLVMRRATPASRTVVPDMKWGSDMERILRRLEIQDASGAQQWGVLDGQAVLVDYAGFDN